MNNEISLLGKASEKKFFFGKKSPMWVGGVVNNSNTWLYSPSTHLGLFLWRSLHMRPDNLCCTQTIKNGNYHGWKAFSFAASQEKKGFLRAGWEMTSSMLYLYCSEQAGLLLSNAFALQASSFTMKCDIFHIFLLGYISHVWSVLSP